MTRRKILPPPSGRIRETAKLESKLERGLRAYAVASRGAVGNWKSPAIAASALSLTSMAFLGTTPSVAEVVYTPANIHVFRTRTGESFASLDINNDGQADFNFVALRGANFSSGADTIYSWMRVYGNGPSNKAVSTMRGLKAALPLGARIGSSQKFGSNRIMAGCDVFDHKPDTYGNFVNVTNRYLGVKFQISGEAHYGWVRITEHCNNTTITGYAYETIANRPIAAGILPFANQSESTPAEPNLQHATLGVLAAGVAGLPKWRLY